MKGNCNKSLKMLFSRGIEELHDDDFDGSKDEDCIFRDVFFGHESGRSSKKCLVTGAINFENEIKKPKNTSFCSNSDNSVMTTHIGFPNMKEDVGQGSLSDECAILARNDPDVEVKRRKVSLGENLKAKPYLEKVVNSSIPSKEVDSFLCQPGGIVTCRLVESSGQGFKSSCYLLKGPVGDMGEKDVSKCRVSSSDTNDQKGNDVSAAIASPVSQESHVSKLLVSRPEPVQCPKQKCEDSLVVELGEGEMLVPPKDSTTDPRPELVQRFKPKWKDSSFVELDEDEMLAPPKDSITDPRPLLRYHIHRLLRAAKWVVGRRNRMTHCRGHGEYVFKSPEGRPIREFHRAWNMCGKKLFADAKYVVGDSDGILWTNLAHFRSHLSNTLIEIEEQLRNLEAATALAHWWYLLDPFAKLVFIDKKLAYLKEGKPVKAKRTAMKGFYSKKSVVLPSKIEITSADQITKRPGKESSNLVPFSSPLCRSDTISCQTSNLYALPVSSATVNTSTGGSESTCRQQDGMELVSGCIEEDGHCNGAQQYGMDGSSFAQDDVLNTKEHKKSKKISEIKLSVPNGLQETNGSSAQIKENMAAMSIETNAKSDESSRKSSFCTSEDRNEKKQSRFRKSVHNSGSAKRSVRCEKENRREKEKKGNCYLDDDDLLLSAILKNRSTTKSSGIKRKYFSPKVQMKYKGSKGRCRLLPRSLTKGGHHHMEGKWSGLGVRTVLCWLIDFGTIQLNEVIQYRKPKDGIVVKDGLVTRDGILCQCCQKKLSVSEFKNHAGFSLKSPCLNLYMESGKPFTLCQLEAWSAEYKVRRGATRTVQVEDIDENDDSCGLCGDGGELICCDNCPSTFHQACLYAQDLPEGSWYCSKCSCWVCGNVVNDNEASALGALKCVQCEHKYHGECLREKGMEKELVASTTWLCGESCKEIHTGLQSLVGIMNPISDGFSWTLLKCFHGGDQKVHSDPRFIALKAECNLKLAVALTIMEECFIPMVDPRTGIDMIPHVVYNWGSEFARLSYEGFYTVILEKDDVILCVASVRIHGTTVAEMPLIATCSKYRKQGMCRRLMNAIEEMLKSFKVEKLVVSAIPSLVDTWTKGFGFTPLEPDEKKSLIKTSLMVFPGTAWLKKPMHSIQSTPLEPAASPPISGFDEATATFPAEKILPIGGNQDSNPNSSLSCKEPPLKTEGSSSETCCDPNPITGNNI